MAEAKPHLHREGMNMEYYGDSLIILMFRRRNDMAFLK